MKESKGIIYVVLAAVLFSTGGLFIKLIDTSAFTITFMRALTAALFFSPLMQWRKIKISKNYMALALAYAYLCIVFVLTTKITTAANAIIFQCTAPLWLYLYYIVKGKKITANELIPRIFILIGIIVILSDSSGGNFKGDLLALTNGIAYAMVQYFLEKDYDFSDQTVVGLNNLILAIIMVIFFSQHFNFSGITTEGWLSLVYLGFFQIGLSYLFLLRGIKIISSLKASIISLIEPILNPIFVIIFVGEVPTFLAFLGFGAILLGVLLTLLPVKALKNPHL